MRRLILLLMLASVGAWGQSSSNAPSTSQAPPPDAPAAEKPAKPPAPDLSPPRSDRVNVNSLPAETGESSSKDSQVDLSAPVDDTKSHPRSTEALADEGSGSEDPNAFRYWDPHKAAKDVEVGDFYFKRKNYAAAESRYREALQYKDNDAIATFRLAVCLEKMERPDEAVQGYESYLKILPHGPEAEAAKKAIDRLKSPTATSKPGK